MPTTAAAKAGAPTNTGRSAAAEPKAGIHGPLPAPLAATAAMLLKVFAALGNLDEVVGHHLRQAKDTQRRR